MENSVRSDAIGQIEKALRAAKTTAKKVREGICIPLRKGASGELARLNCHHWFCLPRGEKLKSREPVLLIFISPKPDPGYSAQLFVKGMNEPRERFKKKSCIFT